MPLIPTTSPDYSTNLGAAINQSAGADLESVSGAVPVTRGTSFITKAGVDVLTLPLPVAGADDGKTLTFVSTTAFAHTITTPANGINGTNTTLTFAAAVANAVELKAFNGIWWVVILKGVTIS